MNAYQRIFGSGPHGLGLSYVTLIVLHKWVDLPDWPPPLASEKTAIIVALLLFAAGMWVIFWSVTSLPPEERGRALVTSGAFHFVRHPLYAGVITFIGFALAIYLNHWLYLLWAIAVHPLMHWAIRYEESLMRKAFPGEYEAYCHRTGRFVPRPRAFFTKR